MADNSARINGKEKMAKNISYQQQHGNLKHRKIAAKTNWQAAT